MAIPPWQTDFLTLVRPAMLLLQIRCHRPSKKRKKPQPLGTAWVQPLEPSHPYPKKIYGSGPGVQLFEHRAAGAVFTPSYTRLRHVQILEHAVAVFERLSAV